MRLPCQQAGLPQSSTWDFSSIVFRVWLQVFRATLLKMSFSHSLVSLFIVLFSFIFFLFHVLSSLLSLPVFLTFPSLLLFYLRSFSVFRPMDNFSPPKTNSRTIRQQNISSSTVVRDTYALSHLLSPAYSFSLKRTYYLSLSPSSVSRINRRTQANFCEFEIKDFSNSDLGFDRVGTYLSFCKSIFIETSQFSLRSF